MPRTLKRRSDAISRDTSPRPLETSEPPRQRQRSSSSASSVAPGSDDEDAQYSQAAAVIESLTKKLVRLALATEYSRTPLRRTDISTKIFKDVQGTVSSRSFRKVFEGAQKVLLNTFGMQLEELPSREKTSLKDRRAQATQTKAGNTSSKAWILVSTLPKAYKSNPIIVQPTKAPSSEDEAGYTALYTFIIALVYMNNEALPEQKLERYLRRVNADTMTPYGNLDKLLQRMIREGYIEKRRDTSSGEEVVEYLIGPRGKVEVGVDGVVGLVKSVYGIGASGGLDKADEDDLNARLSRTLGIQLGEQAREEDDNDAEQTEEVEQQTASNQEPVEQEAETEAARSRSATEAQEPRRRGRPARARTRLPTNDNEE